MEPPSVGPPGDAPPFAVWSMTHCPVSVLAEPAALEEVVRACVDSVTAVWDHHPDAVGRRPGDVELEAVRSFSLFGDDTVEIRATVRAVGARID